MIIGPFFGHTQTRDQPGESGRPILNKGWRFVLALILLGLVPGCRSGNPITSEQATVKMQGQDPILLIHDVEDRGDGIRRALIGTLTYDQRSKCLRVETKAGTTVIPVWPKGTISIRREGQWRIGAASGFREGETLSAGGLPGDRDLLVHLPLPATCLPKDYDVFLIT